MPQQEHTTESKPTIPDPGKLRILVADDEQPIREVLSLTLGEQEGYHVETTVDGLTAIEKIRQAFYHIVFVDLRMPGADGLEVLKVLKSVSPDSEAVIITAYGTISTATQALRAGAYDYITKPFHVEEIKLIVEKIIELKLLQQENINLRRRIQEYYGFPNIIGKSRSMQEIFHIIRSVADTETTVLIMGESGTGKELIAKAIHYNSPCHKNPMVTVNCAAIPEELLESELFGHAKGAFTGASSTQIGKFEAAHGGTVFLDEIGDMSPRLQAKILRILEEREFEPLGSTKTIKVDVRILAATNKDLEEEVKRGRFRQDLFYRLHVVPVILPPLRERIDDLPHLIRHFVATYNKKAGTRVGGFSPQAIEELTHYPWHGNVRELENLIEQMLVMYQQGIIGVDELPPRYRTDQPAASRETATPLWNGDKTDLNKVIASVESDLIKEALSRSGGVKSQAAELLSIKRTTLLEKMRKYNIET